MRNPEIAFWRTVVARAWADALNDKPSRDRDQARHWPTSFSSDCRTVRRLADIAPQNLLQHLTAGRAIRQA